MTIKVNGLNLNDNKSKGSLSFSKKKKKIHKKGFLFFKRSLLNKL